MRKKTLLIILAVIVILVVAGVSGTEYYTSQPKFCGSCHIMKKYYNSWEKSKHGEKDIACIDCPRRKMQILLKR
jgi:nitrate/TMAO reductase-like tetraheme cytochrome c subunit